MTAVFTVRVSDNVLDADCWNVYELVMRDA